MSKSEVKKPMLVTMCDVCRKEINERDLGDWAHIVRQYANRPTDGAKFLRFYWPKKQTFGRVEYDFHAECFDKLMSERPTRKEETPNDPA